MKTTIQISGDLRQRLKILAAYKNTNYENLLHEMVGYYETAIKKTTDGKDAANAIGEIVIKKISENKRNERVKKK